MKKKSNSYGPLDHIKKCDYTIFAVVHDKVYMFMFYKGKVFNAAAIGKCENIALYIVVNLWLKHHSKLDVNGRKGNKKYAKLYWGYAKKEQKFIVKTSGCGMFITKNYREAKVDCNGGNVRCNTKE